MISPPPPERNLMKRNRLTAPRLEVKLLAVLLNHKKEDEAACVSQSSDYRIGGLISKKTHLVEGGVASVLSGNRGRHDIAD